MNHRLAEEQIDAYLGFLHQSLIEARLACYAGDVKRAEDLVDMLHNLPTLLRGSDEPWFKAWTTKDFYDLFVASVRAKYADLSIDWDSVPR